MTMEERNDKNIGKIIRIMGPVVDVRFDHGSHLPKINEALTVDPDGVIRTMEVSQQLDATDVRCIMMDPSEGLAKNMSVMATGSGITTPVGEKVLGRMFNVLGQAIDGKEQPKAEERWPIHRKAPDFEKQLPSAEMLETGIKVIDLLAPYSRGGKIGLFGGAGVGKTVLIHLEENPLRPFVIVRVGGVYLPVPVKGKSQGLELLLEVSNVVFGDYFRVNVVFYGKVFCG